MNKYQESAKELNARLALNYWDKLKISMETIKIAVDQAEKPVIASSFGKDSIALMHLIHSILSKKDFMTRAMDILMSIMN